MKSFFLEIGLPEAPLKKGKMYRVSILNDENLHLGFWNRLGVECVLLDNEIRGTRLTITAFLMNVVGLVTTLGAVDL